MAAADVTQVRQYLEDLLRIPSTNPPGKELPVAEYLGRIWESVGFEVTTDVFAPDRANVVGRRRWGPGPSLVMNGHMDVQPPGHGWTRDPFGAEIDGDRLYGQGAEDMKAGLSAMTAAAVNYTAHKPECGELILTAVADEVFGGVHGTGRLVEAGLSADFAIVCEPTGSDVYLAHRGALFLELTTHGRSAHGGRPWQGRNAINAMIAWLDALQTWAPDDLRRSMHALLPDNTLNIGGVAGGHKVNVVADQCTAQIDLRYLPGQSVQELVDQIRAVGAATTSGIELSVRMIKSVEPMETPETDPLVAMCQRAFYAVRGEHPRLGATAGFQDAHFFANDLRIPTVMFGPYADDARPEDPYPSRSAQPDEWVSLASVTTATRIYEELIHEVLTS